MADRILAAVASSGQGASGREQVRVCLPDLRSFPDAPESRGRYHGQACGCFKVEKVVPLVEIWLQRQEIEANPDALGTAATGLDLLSLSERQPTGVVVARTGFGAGQDSLASRERRAGQDAARHLERAQFVSSPAGDGLLKERQKLEATAAQRIHSSKDLERFRDNMLRFEERALRQGVAESEVALTYKQVARLLEADSDEFLTLKQKIVLAQQVMRNAAMPTTVDSGYHKTCNVTAVESRLYAKYPSDAARLVADIASKGEFTAADGTVIRPGRASLEPDNEARGGWPLDGQRSYASQVFQVTAVNVFWQRKTADPRGNPVPKGTIHYEQSGSHMRGETGERLVGYASGKAVELKDRKGNTIRQPFLRTNDVVEVSNQITGRQETDLVLEHAAKPDNGYLTTDFSSEQELGRILSALKKQNKLPAIFTVHTGNEPFKSDSRSTTSSSGVWHVLTVTDYDENTGEVSVDNQWGTRADHLGRKSIKLSVLYKATLEPGAHKKNDMVPRSRDPVIVGGELPPTSR